MLVRVSKPVMQRAKGVLRIGFDTRKGRSSLSDLHQAGCLKAMLPRTHSPVPDAVMINTAGGLTGGDSLSVDMRLGEGTELRLATQTAERIYRSPADPARSDLRFSLGKDARFDWLAQETILFEAGHLERSITVDMDDTSSALFVEPIILGRTAMGEQVTSGVLKDQWRVHRGGRLIYADALRLGDFDELRHPAALGDAVAIASVLFVDGQAADRRDGLKELLSGEPVEAGCSSWNGFLLARLLSPDAAALRRALIKVMTFLRGREPPRVWMM